MCYALAVASRQESQTKRARAQELLGLFAYHHDAPLVARALGVSMEALVGELEALKIRRRAFSLTRRTTVSPGSVSAGRRAIVQLFRVKATDSGPDGVLGNADDKLFEQQGIFSP